MVRRLTPRNIRYRQRYLTPEIVQKYLADKGEICPFCGASLVGGCMASICRDEEIGRFGSITESGWGYVDVTCETCESIWAEKFEVRMLGMDPDYSSNEFNDRSQMPAGDIMEMEKNGWIWDGDPAGPHWYKEA